MRQQHNKNKLLLVAVVVLVLSLFALATRAQEENFATTYEYFSDNATNNDEFTSVNSYYGDDQDSEEESSAPTANALFFVRNIKRGFRSVRSWVSDKSRRAKDKIVDTSKRAGRAISNTARRAASTVARTGKLAGGWVVETGKRAGAAIKNAFVPEIPKTGVHKASSKGPNYNGASIRNIHDAVKAYTPIVWLHKDEKWFPTSAEKLTDWSKIKDTYTLIDTDYHLTLTEASGKKFDPKAPVYVNVKKSDKGNFLISYAFLYHYNDCGPHVRVWASASFLKLHERIYACPIGIHNGDIEHVTIHVNKNNFKVEQVTFAYHSFADTVAPTAVEWEGTRPVFYSAKGSHATYLTPVDQQYVKIWDERTTGAATFGYLEDYPSKGFKWSPSARWITIGGIIDENTSQTKLSDAERKFVQFQGFIGPQIKKFSAQALKTSLLTVTAPIRKLKSSWNSAITEQIEAIDKELQPTSINGIAKKGWFGSSKTDN